MNNRMIRLFLEIIFFVFSMWVVTLANTYIFQAMSLAESRQGSVLFDPIHYLLPSPINFSPIIFSITYSMSILGIVECLHISLTRFSCFACVYALMLWLRGGTMLLFPLNPPLDIIPLEDSLIIYFTGNQMVFTKDLFFSGHCSSLFLLFLIAKNKNIKKIMFVSLICVATAILFQRVHYTIDIIGGILVAAFIYKLGLNLNKTILLSIRFLIPFIRHKIALVYKSV